MAGRDRTPSDPALFRNPVSLAGAWITTLAAAVFVSYLAVEWFGIIASPYAALFGYIVVPAVFIIGLILIPLGMWREGRRRARGHAAWHWPALDLGDSRTRAIVAGIIVLTMVNVVVVAVASVSAVHYTESNEFCGQVCHAPMEPEFTAHQVSPHSKLECVSCHVAPGASGAITAKMNGTRQLYRLVTGTYATPIPSPRDRIPVPAQTCLNCHSPITPDRVVERAFIEHRDNEASTELKTVLSVYVGKVHWHANPNVRVEYIASDKDSEIIPYVRVTENGKVTEYLASDTTKPAGPVRQMDCLDCHNRPAHQMVDSPEKAIDRAMARGEIKADGLPFARKELVAALTAAGGAADAATGQREIAARLARAFGSDTPEAAQAVQVAQRLYGTSVFPRMKVTWGTYKTQLLHPDQSGCFRCHDDEHKAVDDPEKVVRQDCEMCHLEQEDKD